MPQIFQWDEKVSRYNEFTEKLMNTKGYTHIQI